MTKSKNTDLLYGAGKIAAHLGMSEAQIYHLHANGTLPTFKIGARVCASCNALDEWVTDMTRKAMVGRS